MNILVCVKQVPDTESTVRIAADCKTIQSQDLNFVLNPYDEYAIEEALRLKEARGGEVTLLTVGSEEAKKSLRTGLAMGADKALHVVCNHNHQDSLATARALADAIKGLPHDLILCGKQAVDDDQAQVPIMLAELLGLPSVSAAVKLEIKDGSATARREIETGVEIVETSLPAVITAHKGLNEPRYPSLKGIMMAKKKEIGEVNCAGGTDQVETIELCYPQPRVGGKILGEGVAAVPALVKALHEEAKVI